MHSCGEGERVRVGFIPIMLVEKGGEVLVRNGIIINIRQETSQNAFRGIIELYRSLVLAVIQVAVII